ncbi:MAG TPA: hypothetical protein VF926_15520 [Mycobacterium sp.]
MHTHWAPVGRGAAGLGATPAAAASPRRPNRWFAVLFVSYTPEGIGYIIAGTFLVAAIKQNSSGWLGNSAWLSSAWPRRRRPHCGPG